MKIVLSVILSIILFQSCGPQIKVDREAIPDWGLGPFERDTTAPLFGSEGNRTFDCPITRKPVKWEEKGVLCACAVVKDGKVYLFYRAEDNSRLPRWGTSRIGMAVSEDGKNFVRQADPVLFPDNDFMLKYEWPGGCQDPRIVKTEDEKYVLTYTSWDGKFARLSIAISSDLIHWEKKGLVFNQYGGVKYNDSWTKAGAIVCRQEGDQFIATRINDKYWMYYGEYGLHIATSTDLVNWKVQEDSSGNPLTVLPLIPGKWNSYVTESGPFACITDKGILMLVNGGTRNGLPDFGLKGAVWAMGQVLFDKKDPTKVVGRTTKDFFHPERDYEIKYVGEHGGGNSNVTFIEGLIWFRNEWRFYYGCADSFVASAVYTPKNLR
jgi:beta-1,2-mannosidase